MSDSRRLIKACSSRLVSGEGRRKWARRVDLFVVCTLVMVVIGVQHSSSLLRIEGRVGRAASGICTNGSRDMNLRRCWGRDRAGHTNFRSKVHSSSEQTYLHRNRWRKARRRLLGVAGSSSRQQTGEADEAWRRRPGSGSAFLSSQTREEDRLSFGRGDFKSPKHLEDFLLVKGFELSKWGKGTSKTVGHLWRELEARESVLAVDGEHGLVRRVQVVRVLVRRSESDPFVLIEQMQILNDGRMRYRGTVLAEKMQAGELPEEAAERGLVEELNGIVNDPSDIQMLHSLQNTKSEKRSSISYPNLESYYDLHEVAAVVPKLPATDFSTQEEHAGTSTRRLFWTWHDTRESQVPRGKSNHKVGVLDLRSYLRGSWSFERTVLSHANNGNSEDNGMQEQQQQSTQQEQTMTMQGFADFREHHPASRRRIDDDEKAALRMLGSDFESSYGTQDSLLYDEVGMLNVNGVGVNTTRKLAFDFPSADGSAAVVSFLDGPNANSYFHTVNLTTGKWDAKHICGDDLYSGTYNVYPPAVYGRSKWESTWHVTGPFKRQIIHTVYTRRIEGSIPSGP